MLPKQCPCSCYRALESPVLFDARCVNFGRRGGARNSLRFDLKRKVVHERTLKPVKEISYEDRALKASTVSEVSVAEKEVAYRFRTDIGGQLKVLVRKRTNKFVVYVELVPLQVDGEGDMEVDEQLIMRWGLFRSDSLNFMPQAFHQSSDDKDCAIETPLVKDSVGSLGAEFVFDASVAPFYVSLSLRSSKLKIPTIRSHRNTNFVVPVGFGSGRPSPLGISFLGDESINFAFFSRNSERVVLSLYSDSTLDKPALEIDLDSYVNRTGDIWHALINFSQQFVSYSFCCFKDTANSGKKVLLDPYAKAIEDSGQGLPGKWLGKLLKEPPFDWSGDVRPNLPLEKLIIYRLNVQQFTRDKSSKLPGYVAGTFSGISEKVHHFKDLGVNAVLLEPIFPFDEQKGPYFPFHFFSHGNSFGPSGDSLVTKKSMKEMVKKLHANGIEVLLEVVFTHTGEFGSLREIDNSYYHVKDGKNLNSRHTLNCNYPIVQQMILDSLRHWVIEYHLDGFCFINASSLTLGNHGEFLSRPSLVEAITFDPLLSKIKIIADAWDPHDMETKEIVFPHWKRWAEMNAKFCVDVRNFLRGQGSISNLATRLCGSGDIFLSGRGPAFSCNFVTRNVGLTLVDLVSFSGDELASQLSWNCGEEGPTNKISVLERRLKQIRNYLFILFIALGVPVLNMGDEFGQSCGGSIEYFDRKPLDWNSLRSSFAVQITQFISFLSSLKMRRSDLLQKRSFLSENNIEWHGLKLSPPNWDDSSCKFLAVTLKPDLQLNQSTSSPSNVDGKLFLAFNGTEHSEEVSLPLLQENVSWFRLVDTALSFPGFFSEGGIPLEDDALTYEMESHSCIMLESRSV